MMDWLTQPQADYVIAAYGIALFALVTFALWSWKGARVRERAWEQIRLQRTGQEP